MRIGITYLYAIFRYGYPHSVADALRSIPDIRKLGFRFLEMEGLGRPFLRALYKDRNTLRQVVEDNGVHVHNFCVVDPDMVSLHPGKQKAALDGFKKGAEIAAMLGTETLHLASYAPPVRYLDQKPYDLGAEEGYSFAGGSRIRIPKDFDWNSVWIALVDSCRQCADIAANYGKTVIMEPRVGEVICSVDSQLRLIEDVARPNFKANFDTAHFSAQRENVVLALEKLRNRFANIHIADNNPKDTGHLAIGDGVIDWEEFFVVLKRMNYTGYLGLDLGTSRHLAADYRKSLDRIQSIASKLKIKIEV
ncbi:MAG TPA: sugar phosphate isomerase/epimerase family protein [Bryobacteraceae bacterium]|nr:sugar phosphate isomerase/epimerase family protein [Bryobacteraceae bacterium]